MKIAVIGASAGVGLDTVQRALDLGHSVKALSRREVAIDNERLTHIQGSALNEADLSKAIDGVDAVLVTLGTGMDTKATTLYSDFARLISAMNSQNPIAAPVIVLTGFGAAQSEPFLKWWMKPFFKLILNKVYADKAVMEQIISASSLKWEIVRPGLLTSKPLTEKYRVETELRPGINIGSITRSDVADFMVKEAVNQRYLGKYPALTNK